MALDMTWMDTVPHLGQAGRVDEGRALGSRDGVSFVGTSGGRLESVAPGHRPGCLC